MTAYKSVIYKEVIEIDGVECAITTYDYTDSINEAIDDGAIPHLHSEVIEYIMDDFAQL